MDPRAPLSGGAGQRPPPQRAVSGGSYGSSSLPKRATMPSRLSGMRSVTQPVPPMVDLTGEGVKKEPRNEAAFMRNRDVVLSPDVIKIEDDEEEMPPAKRRRTSVSDVDIMDVDGTDSAYEVRPGSPLPSLPKSNSTVKRVSGPRRARVQPQARRAHGLDPPLMATKAPVPPQNALDFFPWTGKEKTHPEDNLNDTVVKAGYYDKPQSANHSESNSAKPSIWPTLSSKNGQHLPMLGYLCQAVMEKRNHVGRCTAPSTFKPPPRVTVTDTKREAWLRDLANPDVPLRKQSRTIPHGIRGKLLMEQCLAKDIPLPRAVWLAKCVGANELRAFRRKGVGNSAAAMGEAKWLREWTMAVEQFLESVVTTCGQQQGWQKGANYAVKLVTALYAEQLVEVDHFHDWIISSFAEASLERLPVWIALVQIYWKGLTARSRTGRRLARMILEHLHTISEAKDVDATLKTKLQKLVAVMAVSNRGCLIVPRVWEKYRHLLAPKAGSTDENTPAKNITKRNERLAAPLYKTAANTRSSILDLYEMLDSLGIDSETETLTDRCMAFVSDISSLVSALLDWASTPYRTGIARIYHASNVISDLYKAGHDTDTAILSYLRDAKNLSEQSTSNIHRVIIDMVRLDSFAVGKYLQWLITSGMLSATQENSCATSLITALPANGLPTHVLNTRNTLLRRLDFESDGQAETNDVLAKIDIALFEDTAWRFDPQVMPDSSAQSVKLGVSQIVCDKATSSVKDFGPEKTSFVLTRSILERVQDIPNLASLITAVTTSIDGALLATVCDTVNLHANTLAALGQFNSLVDSLGEQYLSLRTQQPSDRAFIQALSSLAQRVPAKASLVKLLADDLTMLGQQNSLVVCSPASDSLVGMHATTLDSDEDIDAVFASGNTMDEQLMQRVFTRIIRRAEEPTSTGPEPVSRVVGWLNQLRSVDGSSGVFDRLVQNYICSVFKESPERTLSASAMANLTISESVSLNTIAEIARDTTSSGIAEEALRMFLSKETEDFGLNECEQYRFRLQRDRCQAEQADLLVTLLRTACCKPDFEAEDHELISFIIRCISSRPGSVRRVFEVGDDSRVLRANASRIITRVLRFGQGTIDATAANEDFDMKTLMSMANPFSVRYCLEAMKYLKAKTEWNNEDESVFENAILESFNDRSDVWAQLLEFAGEKTNRVIHEWAQEQLLSMAEQQNAQENQGAQEHLKRCLELLAITNKSANRDNDATTANTIVEKLKDIEAKLSDPTNIELDSKSEIEGLLGQMQILLDLLVPQIYVVDEADPYNRSRGLLLSTLSTLLVHPKLQMYQEITEYIFDLVSTLADGLSEANDCVIRLSRDYKLGQDPRLDFFLATDNNDAIDAWLALAYHDRPPAPQGSQQQRALAKHQSQQQQRSPNPPSSSPQQPGHQRWPSASGHPGFMRQDSRFPAQDMKTQPYQLRRWEIFPDPTPVMGENDASLSLGLFGARKV